MSASRSPSCWPTAPRVAEDALGRDRRSTSSRCRRLRTGRARRKATRCCSNPTAPTVTLEFRAAHGDADAAFQKRALYAARALQHPAPLPPARWSRAACWREWDAANGRLTLSGAAKVLFFNRRILAKQIGLPEDAIDMIENDVGGGFGARGEFYPEDFLDSVRGAPRQPSGEMDRGPSRASDGDESCARGGSPTSRSPARATAPFLALRGEVLIDMGAYMRTNGAVGTRNVAQFMAGPYRVPHVKLDFATLDDQQDAGRHLSRAGPVRDQFFPRAAARHGGARSRHRPRRVPPPQSGPRSGACPTRSRPSRRSTARTSSTAAIIR